MKRRQQKPRKITKPETKQLELEDRSISSEKKRNSMKSRTNKDINNGKENISKNKPNKQNNNRKNEVDL